MTKRCGTCKLTLPLEAFSTRRASRDGRQNRCRACFRADYLANQSARKAAAAATARVKLDSHRERLQLYLADHPCVDCGEDDIRCLDFDHRVPSDKLANVSQLVSLHVRWQRILDEIAKCDVRCANCHRKRTAEQQQSWRHLRWLAESSTRRAAGLARLKSVHAEPDCSAVRTTYRKLGPGLYWRAT